MWISIVYICPHTEDTIHIMLVLIIERVLQDIVSYFIYFVIFVIFWGFGVLGFWGFGEVEDDPEAGTR